MDKASKAIRRSGVRLKNINSGHSDLHMVISDLNEVRTVSKGLISAQTTTWEDIIKWANKERNTIIQESLQHFFELNALWAEVQKEFVTNLKKFKHQFEVILEGEQHIDKSRAHLHSCQQKENKIRKEIKKANSKGTIEDVRLLEEKLNESCALIKAAQTEVNGKISEQEAVKMIMLKEGLINLAEYYLELSEKAVIIFEAQRNVAEGLPDVKDKEIQDLKYEGSESAKRTVLKAKENVLCHKRASSKAEPSAPLSPPPYSNVPMSPPSYSYYMRSPNQYNVDSRDASGAVPVQGYSLGFVDSPHSPPPPPHYDLPPRENYENIDGAVGGLYIFDHVP